MRRQLASELRKLFTTRTVYWLALGAIGISVMAVVSVSGESAIEAAKPLREQQFFFLATFAKLFIVVLGIRIVTDEYRFGTMVPTFVYQPRRWKVIAAKSLIGVGAGLVIATLVQAALVGTALATFSVQGHELLIDERSIQAIAGSIIAGGLWGGIGVAIGAVVRNQVTAIVGSFIWMMALEEMIASQLGDLAAYLPGSAGFGLTLAAPNGGEITSGLVLLAYVASGLAGGILVTARRDV